MRKSKINLSISAIITLALILLAGCEPNILIKDNPFTAELVYVPGTIVLDKETELKVEIKPLRTVTTTQYYFSYKLLEGSGYFMDKDNNKINENTNWLIGDFLKLITSYRFIADEIGNVKIQMHFFDSRGQVYDELVSYRCDYYQSYFTLEAYPLTETALVEQPVVVNFTLSGPDKRVGEEKGEVNYSMKFETSSNGTFTYNGQEYIENQTFPVQSGAFSGIYTGNSEAMHDITFTVTNDNHAPQSRMADVSIDYTYYQSDFTFEVQAENDNALVDSMVVIDFNLVELLKEDVNYTMVMENTREGVFVYNGTSYTDGQVIPIEPGQSQGYYTGTTDGDHQLTFTVTNDNMHQQSHSDDVVITYNYYQSDFYIIAHSETETANIGDSVRIDFELTEYLKENVNYTMRYTSNGASTFRYNGITYNMNQVFSIVPGNFSGKYVGSDAQTHDITFTVTNDNHIPVEHETDVSIIFEDTDFDIDIDPVNNNAYPNEYASYNFQIIGGGNTATTACLYNMESVNNDGSYMINGINCQNDWCGSVPPIVITGVTNNVLKVMKSKLGLQHFRLFVNKNGITKYVDITLQCDVPPFEITDMHLSETAEWWDAGINVYSTISSDYTQPTNFTYVYKIENTTMGTDNFNDLTLPASKMKTIMLNESLGAGEKTVSVTITNEYGYSQTATAPLTIRDPRPLASFDWVDLSYNYTSEFHVTYVKGTIRGTPVRGTYCDAFRMEYWHPCNYNWQPFNFGPTTWTNLTNNTYNIANYVSILIYHNNGCFVHCKKIRIQVRDDGGRLSEWFVYDETK